MASQIFSNESHELAYEKQYMKSAVLDYPPLWLTLGICSPCAYKCDFCPYHSLDARKISKIYNVKFKMSLEQAKKIIDFARREGIPRMHICATGEPLWHPEFFQILDHVIKRFGTVSFQSSFPSDLARKYKVVEGIIARKSGISGIAVDLMGNPAVKGGDREELYETLFRITSAHGAPPRIGGNFLLSKLNWRDLETVVRDLHRWKLNISVRAVSVFPYGMNAFTDPSNGWTKNTVTQEEKDGMAEILSLAKSLGISLWIPDIEKAAVCDVFWKKLQIWPTRGSEPGRLDNLIPHACNAVVLGNMSTVGYLDDYEDIHSLWNNPHLVKIRQKLLSGQYPDTHCATCPINHFPNNPQ